MNIIKETAAIIVMLSLISVVVGQAYGGHFNQSNTYQVNVPPIGSVYVINVDGTTHVSGKGNSKPVSAQMEFKVVSTKTDGVPSFFLELISGNVSLGENIYELDKGITTIQVNKVNVGASGNNDTTLVKLQATLVDHLPISTSDDPAKLAQGQDRRSANIQVGVENLIFDFHGTIRRTA